MNGPYIIGCTTFISNSRGARIGHQVKPVLWTEGPGTLTRCSNPLGAETKGRESASEVPGVR